MRQVDCSAFLKDLEEDEANLAKAHENALAQAGTLTGISEDTRLAISQAIEEDCTERLKAEIGILKRYIREEPEE